ncbi:DedA family protein [Aliikangiella marina]|uniref:DedA family protein n=1 Tax=Aliikangiella marina TaxID=1712262 RepID=A0A545T2Z7_9GAMM|nr:YqaA family protein [Aliikangiella marina]TQV71593.1 DedA family protein [Aliikangiella marina]
MKIFTKMYESCLRWARHRHATYYLGTMSFAESVIFPVPVDVMLAPMCLSRLEKAWYYAFIATVTSVLGGIFGYFLGAFLFNVAIEPMLLSTGKLEAFNNVMSQVEKDGAWIVFLSAFAPIPYKLVTVSAGIVPIGLTEFIIASIIGRAGRFYLVAGLIIAGGEKMERKLHQIIDYLGWGVVILAILAYLLYKYT